MRALSTADGTAVPGTLITRLLMPLPPDDDGDDDDVNYNRSDHCISGYDVDGNGDENSRCEGGIADDTDTASGAASAATTGACRSSSPREQRQQGEKGGQRQPKKPRLRGLSRNAALARALLPWDLPLKNGLPLARGAGRSLAAGVWFQVRNLGTRSARTRRVGCV